MKRIVALALCLVMALGLFTSMAAADTLRSEPLVEESDPVLNPPQSAVMGSFELNETTYYMGVNGGGFGFPMTEEQYEPIFVRIRFYTSDNDGGSDGNAAAYQEVTDKALENIREAVSEDGLTLTISPARFVLDNGGTVAAPKYYPEISVDSGADWLQPRKLEMGWKQTGVWYVQVSGTINGQQVKGSNLIRWHPSKMVYETFETVRALNEWLMNCKVDNEPIYNLTLAAGTHYGQIVIPERVEDMSFEITGSSDKETILHGGIDCNGGFATAVNNIHFIGAGKGKKNWNGSDANGTADNYALSGVSTFDNCTIEGYYHGVNCSGSDRMLTTGWNSTFRDNDVAIYYNNTEATGGNGWMTGNTFRNNDIALHFDDLNNQSVPMTYFTIRNNQFIGNKTDVRNDEQRRVYLPNNYFGTDDGEARMISYLPVANNKWVSAYPQLARPATPVQMFRMRRDASPYLFDLEENPMVSVAYASDYPIPAETLPGKCITVMDGDTELAVLDFSNVGSAAAAGEFDPTVKVEYSEDGKTITFTMHDTYGMMPEVAVPCGSSWFSAVVSLSDNEPFDAEVSDGYVRFTAVQGGECTIRCTRTITDVGLENALLTGGSAPAVSYTDIPADAWYYTDVAWACREGLMDGTGNGKFSPELATSRAMIVTILWRLEGCPMDAEKSCFSDVIPSSWYGYAVDWAAAFGIVEGANGKFMPDNPITREQLAAMLYRYAKCKGYDVWNAQTGLTGYADAGKVSSYALEPMQWAVGADLITGANDNLMPQGQAARAQTAAILHRFFG